MFFRSIIIVTGDYKLSYDTSNTSKLIYTLLVESGDVTLKAGKGGIDGGSGGDRVPVYVKNGNLTIEGGNYYVGEDANQSGNSTVYVNGSGTITITGGTYKTEKPYNNRYYVLNINNKTSGKFYVKGGTFVNFDPEEGDDVLGGNFVMQPDYESICEEKDGVKYYTVLHKEMATVGSVKYRTLQEAVNAVEEDGTITLTTDVNGSGVKVTEGKKFTIDFANHSYTVGDPLVGSTGTETNGFQLLKDSTITFKNGTIIAKEKATYILIQNYCNLTLENMTLDASGVDGVGYVLSNNCGNIVIENTTIKARTGGVAFDVYGGFQKYGDVTVTVKGSSKVYGMIEVARADTTNTNKNKLVIEGGEFYGQDGDTYSCINAVKGEVVIDGGTFKGGEKGDNKCINVTDATVTVNGGSFSVGADATGVGNSTVYIKGVGTVTIYDGTFETAAAYNNWYYVLNLWNSVTTEKNFIVYGGTFKNYDPAKGDDNKGGNFVADGYASFAQEDGSYVVKEGSKFNEYLVNLGTSITLKVSVIGTADTTKTVTVKYSYGGGEEVAATLVDGYYYQIGSITPQIIDRVYTVKIYEGTEVVASKEISVLGYCDTLLGTTTASEKAKAAVKALIFYGQEARAYLGMTESEDIAAVISKYSLTQDVLTAPEKKVVSTGTELLISSVALNVSDKNAIVYYMTKENFEKVYGTDSKYTVTVADVKVEKGAWSESGEYYVYTGADIYASKLGNQVEVVIKNGETEVQKLEYGAYDYCASKWSDTKVGAIAQAIYAYGVACAAYVAN